ncbi:General stress protein 16O [bacterium HR23]|nr:General stress protein 16O [bacterium HR23]
MPRKRTLSARTLHTLRVLLERERERIRETQESLRRDLRALAEAHGEENGYGTHLADVSSDTLQQEVLQAEIQRLEEESARVQEALQRLQEGTYGSCVDCGRPIPVKRLRALPTALRDATCQRAYDARAQAPPTPSPLGRFPRPLVTPEPEPRPTPREEE